MTYYTKILDEEYKKNVNEIIQEINISNDKMTYIIDALKKG